ncbi:hypothetical protein BOW53_10360 [Solemya pervernicosa gill symbiont]|uniref:Uncharacterized protein n=1 Tax=Solemya pervernicosa gill symbiont TaxID=642797 RepID=A0A1T2L3S8_9GAMM|nr:ATP-grasp fold amidoligase family protein [Solemya pervernicosa gill symbiont]OOZ39768.1 hypothetical protein BOW53_10360 [Solemya pervernicosa gill symbiont]
MSCHGHPLNLENPRSLSEKVLWLKRHVDLEPLSIFTDKFAVRDYVREQIGSDYLIPLIGIYDHVNEIDLDALPDSFMIKTTHR